jgi:hypothetical protein
MTKIILDGRVDIDAFFKCSGVFDSEWLNHTPLLVFTASEASVTVRIINKPNELLFLPDDTPIMGQWRGQWHSDYFQFTVGQYRLYAEAKYDLLKSAKNVIKYIGPKGGFRSLSYEYVNEHGAKASGSTSSKTEADRLEVFFAKHNIPVIQKNVIRHHLQ